MKHVFQNKKIVLLFGIFILAAFFLTLVPETADAAIFEKINTGLRSAGTGILKKSADFSGTLVIIFTILYVLQGILGHLLAFVSDLLMNAFLWNVVPLQGFQPVVIEAWGVMRDIANALLILIVLWIALTIVLNIEHLGGRKLLLRVIVAALLINFSYAIVNAVFGFTNFLALPFLQAVGTSDVGSVIVNNAQIHNLFSFPDLSKLPPELITDLRPPETEDLQLASLLLPFGGPPEAHALVDPASITLGVIAVSAGVWLLKVAASAILAGATVYILWDFIISLAVGNIFLLLVIFAMATAALVLLYRIVAWALLVIFAPAALLFAATPGGRTYWDKWLKYLFRWAFYAPAFFFMFWLSILMLQEVNKLNMVQRAEGLQWSFHALMPVILFLVFLFASVKVAHFMGITVADKFVGWGQKMGWGAVGAAGLGGLALGGLRMAKDAALRGALGKEEGWMHRGLRGAQAIPGLRPLAGVGAEARAKKIKDLQEGVDKRAKELGALYKGKPKDLVAGYRGAQSAPEKAAWAKALGKYSAQLRPNEASEALTFTEKFGMQKDLLKVLPYLAEERHAGGGGLSKNAAVRKYTAEELDFSDIKNIDVSSVLATTADTPDAKNLKKEVRLGLWFNKNFSPAGLARLADEDRAAAQALLDDIDPLYNELLGYAPPSLTAGFSPAEKTELLNTLTHVHEPAFKKYFSGTMGRSLGLTEPTAW